VRTVYSRTIFAHHASAHNTFCMPHVHGDMQYTAIHKHENLNLVWPTALRIAVSTLLQFCQTSLGPSCTALQHPQPMGHLGWGPSGGT